MHLAINYSPAAARLVKSGKINIAYFKTPDWDWMIEEAQKIRPVAIHFTLEAGNGSLGEDLGEKEPRMASSTSTPYTGIGRVDWEKVQQQALSTGTPYINLHLDARSEYYPDIPVNTTTRSDIQRIYKILLADVTRVVNLFGPARVIIENSPFRNEAGKTMRPCVEPEVITQIVKETGCGFLLDISHAFITAHYLGMANEEYFSRLPLQHIKEMHFAGIHQIDGQLKDHLPILADDWRKLDWVLENIRTGAWSQPWLLAFEYGGVGKPFAWRSKPEVIVEQVPQLYEHLKLLDN